MKNARDDRRYALPASVFLLTVLEAIALERRRRELATVGPLGGTEVPR